MFVTIVFLTMRNRCQNDHNEGMEQSMEELHLNCFKYEGVRSKRAVNEFRP